MIFVMEAIEIDSKMDHMDERTKKVKAGKEKLAAFLKKKSKSKKTETANRDITSPQNEEGSPEVVSPSAFSVTDSDQFSFTSGDEGSAEESEIKSIRPYSPELADIEQNVVNTEKSQLTLGSYVLQSSSSEQKIISDIESALSKRDELISKLTQSLQASFWQNIPNDEVMTQVQALVEHVGTLQAQLLQADQSLQEQLELHEASALALQAAKEQMLQLQFILNCKDAELDRIIQTVHKNSQSVHSYGLKERSAENFQGSCLMCEQYSGKVKILEEALYNKIRECERWSISQQEWLAREQTLLSSAGAESQQLKQHETMYNCEIQQTSLDGLEASDEDKEQIDMLKLQLEKLKHAHDSEAGEISTLKQGIVHEAGTGDGSNPSSCELLHNEYATQHSQCLSQIEHLTSLNLDLQRQLSSLSSVEKDLADLHCEYRKLYASYQEEIQVKSHYSELYSQSDAMYSSEKDNLIAKVSELQNEVDRLQAALHSSAVGDNNEKMLVVQLQQELIQRDEELKVKLTQLTEVHATLNTVRCNYDSLEKSVLSYEEVIASLTQQLQAAEHGQKDAELEALTQKLRMEQVVDHIQNKLKEKDLECKQYTENIIKLQDELLSNQHVHSVEISEKEQQLEDMEEHMAVLDSERAKLTEKVKHLEQRLKLECQQYMDNLQHVMAEKELECKHYTENIVRLQDELISVQHAHDIDIFEKNNCFEMIEEQVELLSTEKLNLEHKVNDLEHKLAAASQNNVEDVSSIGNEMEITNSCVNVLKMQNELLLTHNASNLLQVETASQTKRFDKELEDLRLENTELSQKVNMLEEELCAQGGQIKATEEIQAVKSQLQPVLDDRGSLQTDEDTSADNCFLQNDLQTGHSEHKTKGVDQDVNLKCSVHKDSGANLDSPAETVCSDLNKVSNVSDSVNKDLLNMFSLKFQEMLGRFEYQQTLAVQWRQGTEQLKTKISEIDKIEESHIKAELQEIVDGLLGAQLEFSSHIESLLKQVSCFEIQELEKKPSQTELQEQKREPQPEPDHEVCQEALQAQLKSTISQWQKLQLIVQEKEIELHRLQDSFDEQQRISSSMIRSHEQQRCLLQAEMESLRAVIEQQNRAHEEQQYLFHQEIESMKTVKEQQNKADILIDKQGNLQSSVDSVSTELKEISNKVKDNEAPSNTDEWLAQKEIEISELKISLALKESENSELVNSLTLFQEEIVNLKNKICDLQLHGKTIKENMKQRESDVGILEDSLYGSIDQKEIDLINWKIISESQIRDLNSVIAERELEIDRLKLVNAEIFSENTALKDQIEVLEFTLCDLKNCLANRASEVNVLNDAAADSKAEIDGLKHLLTSKESEIDMLRDTIAGQESEIKVFRESIADKQTEINALQHHFENIISENTVLKSVLAEKGLGKSTGSGVLAGIDYSQEKLSDKVEDFNSATQDRYDVNAELVRRKLQLEGIDSDGRDVAASGEPEIEIETENQNYIFETSVVEAEKELLTAGNNITQKDSENMALNDRINETVSQNDMMQDKLSKTDEERTDLKQTMEEEEEIEIRIGNLGGVSDDECCTDNLQTSASEVDLEVTSLKQSLAEKEFEISILKIDLNETKNQLQTFQAKFGQVGKEMMPDIVLEKDLHIQSLTERLYESEIRTDTFKTTLDETEHRLMELRNLVGEKDSEISTLTGNANEAVNHVELLRSDLIKRDQELATLRQADSKKEVEISSLAEKFDGSCHQVEALNDLVSNQNKQLEDVMESVKEKEAEICSLKEALCEASMKESKMQSLIEEFSLAANRVDSLNEIVCNKSKELAELEDTLENRNLDIGGLNEKLHKASNDLDVLHTELSNANKELIALRSALKNKDIEISSLTEKLLEVSSLKDSLQTDLRYAYEEVEVIKRGSENKDMEINSLKKQTEQLQEVGSSVDVLHGTINLLNGEVTALKTSLENKDAEISSLIESLQQSTSITDVLKEELSKANDELGAMKNTLENKDKEIITLNEKLQESCSHADSLNIELNKQREELAATKHTLEDKVTELSTSVEKLQEANSRMDTLQNDIDHANEQVASLRSMLESRDTENHSFNAQLQESSSYVDTLKSDLRHAFEELAAQNSTLENNTLEINSLNDQLNKANTDLDVLHADLRNATEELVSVKGTSENKEIEIISLKEHLQETNSHLDLLNAELIKTNEEVVTMKSSIEDKDREITSLKELIGQLQEVSINVDILHTSLRQAHEEVSSMMISLENKQLEICTLNEELQKANSKVNVLTADLRKADEELAALKDTAKNKDMEINALNEKVQEANSCMNTQQTDLKNTNEELTTLKSCLENRDLEMMSLAEQVQEANSRVDILRNDLDNANEELVAIKCTLVNKTLQMAVCSEKLQESSSSVQILHADLEKANEELAVVKSSLECTDLEISNLNEQVKEISSLVDVLLWDLRNANEELMSVKSASENKDTEINSLKEQLQEANSHVIILNTELKKSNEEVAVVKYSVENKEREMDKLNEQLQEFKDKVDVMHTELRNTNCELSALKNTLDNKELELGNFNERVHDSDNTVGILQTDLRNANEELAVLKNCVFERESHVVALKEELSLKECKISNLSEDLSVARTQVEKMLLTQEETSEELAAASQSLLMSESEVVALKEQLSESGVQISSLTLALGATNEELMEMRGCLEQKESELSALTETNTELVSQLAILNTNLVKSDEDLKAVRDSGVDAESHSTLLEQKLCDSRSQNEALQTSLKENEESLAVIIKEKDDARVQVLTLQDQLDLLGVDLHELKTENSGLKLALDASQENKDHLQSIIIQKEKELCELTSQVNSLEQQITEISDGAEIRNAAEHLQKTELEAKEEEYEHARDKLSQEIDNLKSSIEEKESVIAELNVAATTAKSEFLQQEFNFERINLTLKTKLSALAQEAEEMSATVVLQELKLLEQDEEISQFTDKLNGTGEQLQEMSQINRSLQQLNEALTAESHANLTDIIHQREALEQQVVEMESMVAHKEREISEIMQSAADDKISLEQLSAQLLALERNYKTLLAITSHHETEILDKEAALIEQNLLIDEQSMRLNELSETLTQVNLSLNEVNELNIGLKAEIDALQGNKIDLEQRISKLQSEFDSQELTATQFMVESKQLSEKLTQMTHDLDTKGATLFDLQHDCEMYIKEINDLKQELEQKDLKSISLKQEVESCCSLMERSKEEKEMLKANFDSCMEEVQQKLSDQEIELKRLRAQLAEETKNVCQDQNQMKEIYEQQIAQMEEKLLQFEKQCERLDKELIDVKAKSASAKDVYEHQLSEQELHLQSTNSELLKLKDHLSKITNNHKCEMAGLKKLCEIQTSELEESCLALERTVAEQKRLINENTTKFNRERFDLEQNFEIQLSDVEEKRRISEMEISRLKKHLDEMKFDHEKDLHSLEKSCEARLYELEDKYCNATNELEKLRKSMFSTGGYSEERHAIDMRVEELETLRRDLENRNSLLEDDIAMMRDQAHCREEEMKAVLKNAAEEQQRTTAELTSEILGLQQQMSESDHRLVEMRKEYESQVTELQSRNRQLEEKICSLEMLIEEDSAMQMAGNKHDNKKKRNRLAHLHENASLKTNVSSLTSLECVFSPMDSEFSSMDLETFPSDEHNFDDRLPTSDESLPIVEGFVAEPSLKFLASRRLSQPNAAKIYKTTIEKSDFVEEQCDGFQLEIPAHDSSQCSDHPIHENVIREGFEPEAPDHFLLETPDEPVNALWQHEIAGDLSPSHMQPQQGSFDFSTPEKAQRKEQFAGNSRIQDSVFSNFNNSNIRDMQFGYQVEKPDVSFEKCLNDIREELEEEYVTKMRQQEIKLTLEYETSQAEYKLEMEQHFAQRMKAVRYEWERKFNKALQKVQKELEKQHRKELKRVQAEQFPEHHPTVSSLASGSSLHGERDLMSRDSDGTESSDEVEDHTLSGNEEIADPSDVMLGPEESAEREEITADKQTNIASRKSSSSTSSTTSTPTLTAGSPVVDREAGRDEAESAQSEVSDTSSAQERFLEELEEMSQQSSQDLPLEWELTSTVIEAGSFEREPEHQSVWEVFDGRCVRQDCQELDTLRIQYEHQISTLQRQLDAERRNTQEQMEQRKQEYAQLVSDLRAKLDQEEQEELDNAISELTKVQSAEIENINATYQYELSLELTALKLSMEQIYSSKLQLEMSDMKMRYDQRLEALNKQHKEEINMLAAKSNNIVSSVSVNSLLTDQYNSLIQNISKELEKILPVGQEKVDLPKHSHDGVVNGEEDQVPSIHFAQDLHNLLLTQQEEILSLRSKLLSEYESLLQHRAEVMESQSSQVTALEEQILQLERQCGEELRSKQKTTLSSNGELSEEPETQTEKLELQLEELRSYYEAKLEHMRSSFEKEINLIKEDYEQQIKSLVSNKLEEPHSETLDSANLAVSISSSDHHEDKPTRTIQASVSDTNTKDIPQSADPELSVAMKRLESELADKCVQCKELMDKLKSEEFRSNFLDVDVANMRKEMENLQQKSSEALSQCSRLQDLLLEKDAIIAQLEMEKGESEKLYRDHLEKESSSSQLLVKRDYLSGTDGDDSFISAIDVFRDTQPHAANSLDHQTSASANHEENLMGNVYDFEGSLPLVPILSEVATSNINNNSNSNNNYSDSALSSLEGMVENLKKHIEELDQQLIEAREREAKLQAQIEDKEYNYKEMFETMRLELDHERQMEVETLQSEFKVQLEIELKRQAAELLMSQSTPQASAVQTEREEQEAEAPSAEVTSQMDSEQSATSEVFAVQKSDKEDSVFSQPKVSDSEHRDALHQQAVFNLQQATLEAALMQTDTASVTVGNSISEHSTEEQTVTVSESAAGDRCESVSDSTHVLSVIDMENVIAKIENQCDERIAVLKDQLEQLSVEREVLISRHQEEIDKIRQQLNEAEDKYEQLLEDIQSGERKEVDQLLKDKYDDELEMAKSIMQKEFDQTLAEEKKMFVERHRQLMGGFMEDGERREQEAEEKHQEELQALNRQFEQTIEEYEQEIERLNHDLRQLREARLEETEEPDGTMKSDRTLPEIDEITFSFQEVDAKADSPDSPRSQEASTEPRHHYTDGTGAVYHGSDDDETDANTISTMQLRTFADVVKTPAPLTVQERRQFELKIQQLVAEVERLRQLLREAEHRESTTAQNSPAHLSSSDFQTGDDPALIAMLRSDIERISAERESILRTNSRLLSLLSENVKTYIGVEDSINHRLSQVVAGARTPTGHPGDDAESHELSQDSLDLPGAVGFTVNDGSDGKGASPDADVSQDSHGFANTSLLSNATDEGLEVSQRLAESIFVGPDLDAEGEDILTDARGRLQSAVGQLLELMERSTVQLMEAKATQQELLDSLASRAQELELTKVRCSELDGQLTAEIEAKEYLVLELHKAEGLISGYSTERESLESQIQSLEDQREVLIVELDTARSQPQELPPSETHFESTGETLSHQPPPPPPPSSRQNTGPEIQANKQQQDSCTPADGFPVLLDEIANLSEDKKELSSQLQYQIDQLQKQLLDQETVAEESERRHEAAMEERNQAVADLKLQLENVEKLLKANKAFVEEQMAEREQEREEHQQEIQRLEQLIEGKDRNVSSQQRLQLENSDLIEQLQARIASQNSMHQRILDLQKSLEDKELSAHDLKAWVSQLECELDQRGSVEEQLKQRINKLEKQLTEKSEESDATEEEASSSLTSKEEKGGSPTQLSPAKQCNYASSMSLKEELERAQQIEEELKHENVALKEQLQQQLLQISGLRNQLDHLRHYGGNHEDSDATQLRLKLQAERDKVEEMEEKLYEAQNKLDKFEHILQSKEEEAEDVKTKVSKILEMGDAREENESLKEQLKELQTQVSHLSSQASLQALPPELLEEKNIEIEELKHKLQLIETQLSQMMQEDSLYKSTIFELQARLKEKDEEISDLQDSISSLRRGEACLDVSLPLNEDTGNMLNISMTGRTTVSAMAAIPTSIQQELEESIAEKEKSVFSLQQELEQARNSLEEQVQNVKNLSDLVETLQKQKDVSVDMVSTVKQLEETVTQKDKEIYDLTLTMQELQLQVDEHVKVQENIEKDLEVRESELTEIIEDRDRSQELLHEKEDKLEQLILQIDSLQHEITSLTSFQHELQKDFDTVQSMLEDKEKELENMAKEFADSKVHQETLHEIGNIKEELRSAELKLSEITKQFQKEQKLRMELEDQLVKEKVDAADVTVVNSGEANQENTDVTLQTEAEQDNLKNDQEIKISALEQELHELKVRAESDARLWEEMKAKQHSAELISSEENKMLPVEIESLKLQIKEKDALILSLQADLNKGSSDEQVIKNISNLECQDGEVEMFSSSKQAEQLDQDEVELKRKIESKEMTITELEGQLRFRQSCILDLTEEKERILEEKQEMETDFQEQLQKMDKSLSDLQKKYDDLKKGISEEVHQMEQDIDRRSQAQLIKQSESEKEVDELKRKVLQDAGELTDLTSKHKEAEERLSQVSQQLIEREEQIQQLQNEVQNLQVLVDQPHSGSTERDLMVKELEHQLRQAKEAAAKEALTAAESREIIAKLEREVHDLKQANNSRENSVSPGLDNMSTSLPLQGISRFAGVGTGMSRWDSAPAALSLSNRDSMHIHYSVSETERWTEQQRKELAEKNRQLDKLRQDLERWLRMGKGQDSLMLTIKEKEETIITYQTEIETIKAVLKEKDQTISSLRTQIQSLHTSNYEALSSKDHVITELEKQIYILKSTSVSGASSPSRNSATQGESLSPETKQSISHLKMQLRKAHAALEEMQQTQVEEIEVGDGDAGRLHKPSLEKELEELRNKLRVREEELSTMKLQFDSEVESRVLVLGVQHDQDILQQKQQQEKLLSQQKEALQQQYQAQLDEVTLQKNQEVHHYGQIQDHGAGDQNTQVWDSYKMSGSDGEMPERLQAVLHHLNQLGEELLSVSDKHFLQKHLATARLGDSSADHAVWEEERQSLLENISALKNLLKQSDQVLNTNDNKVGDWRVGLLHALAAVYEKEQKVLQVEVNISRSLYPEVDLFAQLETKVRNLEQIHQSGLDEMLKADRQSLVDEIDNLRQRLLEANSQLQENQEQVRQQVVRLEEVKSSTEWKLQRQIQMLEYKLQQESVVQEDMKNSLKLERQRVAELSSQSSQDRSRILELQSELSATQINLSKVRDTLEREQQRFHSVTDALEEERAKTIRLTELLESSKRKFQVLQEELNHSDVRYQQKVHSEEDYIKELQDTLVKERERSIQFSEAEEQARREITRLADENDILNRKLSLLQDEHKAEVDMLHTEQKEKKLQAQLEDNSVTVARLTAAIQAERDDHLAAIQHEEKLSKQLRRDVDQLRSENSQLKHLYETERSHADALKSDLENARTEFIEQRRSEDTLSTHRTSQNHLQLVEQSREELIDRVKELETELARVQERASELNKELETARSKPHIQSARSSHHVSQTESRTFTMTQSSVDKELQSRLSQCCSKLQMLAGQLHDMTTSSRQHRGSPSFNDAAHGDALVTIMSELQELRSEIKRREETLRTGEAEGSTGAASSAEMVKLREHNQQLADHIVKVTREKEKLVETLKNLEKRFHLTLKKDSQAQVNIPQYISDTASEEDSVYDRTIWASERLSLQIALDSAEHEIQRLRTEIQNFKSSLSLNGHPAHTDPDKTNRLYGKYLRAESFRKALIYQKKYLLLLLGSYRDTEQETLAILASMGGFPSYASISSRGKHSRAFMMFRSAGRVVIAVFRMKYLVKKWKRATRVGSPVVTGQINHQHAYIPSNSAYMDHQRHSQEPSYSHQHSPSANTRTARSGSSNVDHFSSLSNEGVSSLASEAYQGAASSRVGPYRYTTPPTKDPVAQLRSNSRGKSEESRRRTVRDEDPGYRYTPSARPQYTDNDDGFLQYLENVQQELSEGNYSTPSLSSTRRVTWR